MTKIHLQNKFHKDDTLRYKTIKINKNITIKYDYDSGMYTGVEEWCESCNKAYFDKYYLNKCVMKYHFRFWLLDNFKCEHKRYV